MLDTSGSMRAFPIEKAKETMKLALDGSLSARHVQPDHVLGRHAHPVPGAGAGHGGEFAQGAGISRRARAAAAPR